MNPPTLRVPPLHVEDPFWIMVEGIALGPRGADLWPKGRALRRPDWIAAYRLAFQFVIEECLPRMREAGVVPPAWRGTPRQMREFFLYRFARWHHVVLPLAMGSGGHRNPRFSAIRDAMEGLTPLFDAMIAREDWVAGLVHAARRKGGLDSIDVGNLTADEIWAEASRLNFEEDKPGLIWVGDDGNRHLSFDVVYDALRHRRRRPVGGGESLESVEAAGPDPMETAGAADLARHVREVRESVRGRGPEYRAAMAHLEGGASRKRLAAEHGTTASCVRRAEIDIKELFQQRLGDRAERG